MDGREKGGKSGSERNGARGWMGGKKEVRTGVEGSENVDGFSGARERE